VGDRIVCTLTGQSFGFNGTLLFNNSAPTPAVIFAVPSADILSWNHTAIVFYMPRGYGQNVIVTVYSGTDSAATYNTPPAPVTFSYDPPMLSVRVHCS